MDTLELTLAKDPKKRKRSKFNRQPYLDLTRLVSGYGLCIFCRYAEWNGCYCDDIELHCQHPLPVINGSMDEEHPYDVWSGDSDCWGFRPDRSLQRGGVYIGILLEGNIPHYSESNGGELVAIIPSKRDLENRYW